MKKGDLVRLNIAVCFTTKQGGSRRFPLTNGINDTGGTVEATRLATDDDVRSWRDSDASKGMTDGGDTRLAPTCYSVRLRRDRVYTLLRARCRPEWGYRKHPGMALVLCTVTGKEAYVKRDLIEVVEHV